MRIIQTKELRNESRVSILAGDFTILDIAPNTGGVNPYLPYLTMFEAILQSRGTIGFWLWEPGSDLKGIIADQQIQPIGVAYTAIGGCFSARLERAEVWEADYAWIPSDLSQLCPNEMKYAVPSDRWVAVWPSIDIARVQPMPKREVGKLYDVTEEILSQLLENADVVVMGYHDGNPIIAHCRTIQGRDRFIEWVDQVEKALQKVPWIQDHQKDLRWDEEFWAWELSST